MLPHETLLQPVYPFVQGAKRDNYEGVSSVKLSVLKGSNSTVKDTIFSLSECLKLCHRKPISWVEPSLTPQTTWLEYTHIYLTSPLLQLFNNLRVPDIEDDMSCHAEPILDTKGTVKLWFTSPDFDAWEDPVYPPTIYITPDSFPDTLDTDSDLRTLSCVLLPIIHHIFPRTNPSSTTSPTPTPSKTIFTDLRTAIIIHPPSHFSDFDIKLELVPFKDDLRAFRIIVAACLLDALPQSTYLNPPTDLEGDYLWWLPPRKYEVPAKPLTDTEIFNTNHRHSDFDILHLIHNLEEALQFFRWRRHVENHVSPDITHPGDIIEGTTDEFDRLYHPPRGICSKPIPPATLDHMKKFQRRDPLSPEVRSALEGSKRFTIKLGRALGESTNARGAIARVHVCHIQSIDGTPIPTNQSPQLVMKVFDDRFTEVINPYSPDGVTLEMPSMNEKVLPDFFQGVITAEWHVRGELTAFEKMEVAQGSLIPHFYGAHKFRLANGHEVYGILMEYVDAMPLSSGVAGKWSEEQHGQLMTSIRHGLRVIQYCDISQHDWHSGQILCNLSSTSSFHDSKPQAHAILIDFSATLQTLSLSINLAKDDYGRCISAITFQDITGIDERWIFNYWDREDMKRETWDAYGFACMKREFVWSSRGADPYEFVYEEMREKEENV